MWARVVEFMLACWLAASPFIFHHSESARALWRNDFAIAVVVGAAALLSYWRPTMHAHLFTLVAAIWLIGFGRFGLEGSPGPGMQNEIVVGLLLLMFAIVPNNASQPPRYWYSDSANSLIP